MFISQRTHLMRGVVRRFTSIAPPQVRIPAPKLFIDGAFVNPESSTRLPVLSPRDGQAFAELANASAADVNRAVASARHCFDAYLAGDSTVWPAWLPARRAKVLRRMSTGLLGRLDEVAYLESLDCGKPIADARADVEGCAALLNYYASLVDPPTISALAYDKNHESLVGNKAISALEPKPLAVPEAGVSAALTKEPFGVVGAITPWNYPLAQAIAKLAPALAAGCCVVLKPSPLASLTCLLFAEVAVASGLPRGALQVLTGGPPGPLPSLFNDDDGVVIASATSRNSDSVREVEEELLTCQQQKSCGEALSSHPGLDKLSFTGSTAAGIRVLSAGAPWLRPTGLELGGKGALLVFPDANLEAAVDWTLSGAFANSGQVCSATSRVLVHADVAEAFCDLLVASARAKLVVGDPLEGVEEEWEEGSAERVVANLGPLVSAQQMANVERMIEAAHADLRCTALLPVGDQANDGHPLSAWRGKRDPRGYYVAPQIFKCIPGDNVSSSSSSSSSHSSSDRSSNAGGNEGWPAVWHEEVFGPVLCVATFHDLDEGVQLANASPYGLAHAVFSACPETRATVSRRVRAGVVWENCSQAVYPDTPFGGCKQSGFGREYGELGLEEYLHHKTVVTAVDGHMWRSFG